MKRTLNWSKLSVAINILYRLFDSSEAIASLQAHLRLYFFY